jgi:CubicO group peptidase (beta-lactamase class C family)
MKHSGLYIFLSITCLAVAGKVNGQVLPQDHYLYEEIQKIVRYETGIQKEKTPGYIVGIVSKDSTYILPFGYREPGSSERLTPSDVFEVGSISKVFTATILAQLVAKEKIGWDHSINLYLPDQCRNEALQQITISDLASNQSGFPKLPPFFGLFQHDVQNPFASYPKSELCSFLYKFTPNSPVQGVYSHLNFAILEILLEHNLGMPFDEIADQYLFHLLDMNESSFGSKLPVTPGYHLSGKKAKPWDFQAFAASEGARSSLNDLMTFMQWNLALIEDGTPDTKMLVHLHAEMIESDLGDDLFMGHGWHITHPKKRLDVFIHSGKTNGHHASIGFCRQTNTGVVVLSNSSAGTDNLGYLILRMINHNWKRKS